MMNGINFDIKYMFIGVNHLGAIKAGLASATPLGQVLLYIYIASFVE
jgi:hypothetical protein